MTKTGSAGPPGGISGGTWVFALVLWILVVFMLGGLADGWPSPAKAPHQQEPLRFSGGPEIGVPLLTVQAPHKARGGIDARRYLSFRRQNPTWPRRCRALTIVAFPSGSVWASWEPMGCQRSRRP